MTIPEYDKECDCEFCKGERKGQQREYIINDEDISCLSDYIESALSGDESKITIRRLVAQEFGVIRSRPYTSKDR